MAKGFAAYWSRRRYGKSRSGNGFIGLGVYAKGHPLFLAVKAVLHAEIFGRNMNEKARIITYIQNGIPQALENKGF